MTGQSSPSWRWRKSRKALVRALFSGCLIALGIRLCFATGFYGPTVYLDEGGHRVLDSPEFYWELEVKRLARDFHPPEEFTAPSAEERANISSEATREEREKPLTERTTKIDLEDFASALRDGRIKPPDSAQATKQHEAARAAIASPGVGACPPEFASEFADYHRGAFAFAQGAAHWDEAHAVWEALLARPAAERHDRSVWAAFMLGKLALKKADYAQAVTWFQRTRELAHDGFADSLGMAADSYGWEGRAEWKRGYPEKAAPLYLTQLALGDVSAVISLKALIPDRAPVGGMLNYGPEPDEQEKWDDATRRAADEKGIAALKAAARDPLLRRLVTVHVLATQAEPFFAEETGRPAVQREARWLSAVEAAKVEKIDDAEYLGWVAYGDGQYPQAARWLALSSGETPAALWLKAKLERRAGKLDDAVRTMAKAWEIVRDDAVYTGWKPPTGAEEVGDDAGGEGNRWRFGESASGDLGGLRLARSEFVGALDAFVKGKLWSDAAFIAERVLTLDELKKYVDAQPIPPVRTEPGPPNDIERLRYMLARRLVREDRYEEAPPYLPPLYAKRLETYVKALRDGVSTTLTKKERARAYFTAAWIARYDGMELMGTEGAPDGFISEGSFPEPDLAQERLSGTYLQTTYDTNGSHEKRVPAELKPTAKEKDRLTKQKIRPDVRFHYRVIAAALASRAAELLPDNSEELADTLNEGGSWAADRDQKMADASFLMLTKRASKTEIGQAAIAKHWFVDQSGPWSDEEQAARAAALGKSPDAEE